MSTRYQVPGMIYGVHGMYSQSIVYKSNNEQSRTISKYIYCIYTMVYIIGP